MIGRRVGTEEDGQSLEEGRLPVARGAVEQVNPLVGQVVGPVPATDNERLWIRMQMRA